MKKNCPSFQFTTLFTALLLGAALLIIGCLSSGPKISRDDLQTLISRAEAAKTGIKTSGGNGAEYGPGDTWVPSNVLDELDSKINTAKTARSIAVAYNDLGEALAKFVRYQLPGGSNPYEGAYPGDEPPIVVFFEDNFAGNANNWAIYGDSCGDSRFRNDDPKSTTAWENALGGGKFKLNVAFTGPSTSSYYGVPLQYNLPTQVDLTKATWVSFDFIYPQDSSGKLMRLRLYTTSEGTRAEQYVRPGSLDYENDPVVGTYKGVTYRTKTFAMKFAVTSGTTNYFKLDFHSEATPNYETAVFIANLKVIQELQSQNPIGPVAYTNLANKVPSLAERYKDMFMVGSTNFINAPYYIKHVNTTTHGNELKPGSIHPRGPSFLVDPGTPYGDRFAVQRPDAQRAEWEFTTADNQFGDARSHNFNFHGHTLAWFSQSAQWMVNMVPTGITGGEFNPQGNYISRGTSPGPSGDANGTVQVDKETARRAYYDHIVYAMRHYSSDDPRYAGSRLNNPNTAGIFPLASWDVLNEELNETRHSSVIPAQPDEWKTTLRNTSWLRAMTGDAWDDLSQHYVYLLFKYAHIAVPNARMAAKYKANYAALPAYLKLDNHDEGGSIDKYVVARPPVLYYNDYGLNGATKAKAVYNMVKELNTLWLKDVLYDGRPLIEAIGFQGHYSVSKTLEKEVRASLDLFKGLIDQGLLTAIGISELDMVCGEGAPGGAVVGANLPNQKQADAVGYQFALLYKLFAEYSKYIERVTTWGILEPAWNNHLIFFRTLEGQTYATPGYYGAYDPDRYIAGHSYLEEYFK